MEPSFPTCAWILFSSRFNLSFGFNFEGCSGWKQPRRYFFSPETRSILTQKMADIHTWIKPPTFDIVTQKPGMESKHKNCTGSKWLPTLRMKNTQDSKRESSDDFSSQTILLWTDARGRGSGNSFFSKHPFPLTNTSFFQSTTATRLQCVKRLQQHKCFFSFFFCIIPCNTISIVILGMPPPIHSVLIAAKLLLFWLITQTHHSHFLSGD